MDAILSEAGFDKFSAVRIAAWLHDVLEDSEMFTSEDLRKRFGDTITDIVERVTNEPGANRRERSLKTYPKTAEHVDSIAVKVADRIANMEQSIHTFSRFGLLYLKEDVYFRQVLMTVDGLTEDERMIYLWRRYKTAVETLRKNYGIS